MKPGPTRRAPAPAAALVRAFARVLAAALAGAAPGAHAAANPDAAATAVVFNAIDPLSEEIARFYAEKRGIPPDQVVGLPCAMAEEVPREQFDRELAGPLRDLFTAKGWWRLAPAAPNSTVQIAVANRIRYLALCRSVPLKIAASGNVSGEPPDGPPEIARQNAAAVDSELAALGIVPHPLGGAIANPYFKSYQRIRDAPLAPLLLVARLDGPSGIEVKRMIEDSLAAERLGPWGFAYIDVRNIGTGALAEGDRWLRLTADSLQKSGVPVVMGHASDMFPEEYPMREAMFYYGWYNEHASGPFARPTFRFNRGAVAVHIHSFSAATVRIPTRNWVAPLILRGAAATLGNVYEPYLGLTTHLDIFQDRLAAGFTFAESAYMATPSLSWMNTFVGDPLYRPFNVFHDLSARPSDPSGQWIAFREGARTWFERGRAAGEKALAESGRRLRSGVIFEGLAALQAAANDPRAALLSSQTARGFYTDPADTIRAAYREANLLVGIRRRDDALDLIRSALKRHADHPAAAVLRSLEAEINPPPAARPLPARPPPGR